MGKTRRLVLDTLKPHEPGIIEMAQQLSLSPFFLADLFPTVTSAYYTALGWEWPC